MNSFEELLETHRSAVERFVKFRISSLSDAEDILQDVYLTAYRNFARLQNPESFKAWLITIARNRCNDWLRERSGHFEISFDRLPEPSMTYGSAGRTTTADTVRDTLDRLGAKDRQILTLFYLQDLPQTEIARRLNLPVGTVKSRLYTAKQNFKKAYPYHNSKGETIMTKLPEILPEYTITPSAEKPFPVKFEELTGWFIIPRLGEKAIWASYDLPERKMTESVASEVTCKITIHDVEGVEIKATFQNISDGRITGVTPDHIYYAQLTDTHCRWLGESYFDKEGTKHLLTYLDGDEFTEEWGFGENNCGNEIHLSPKGDITRTGTAVTAANKKYLLDVTGRCTITMNGRTYDTVCIMMIFQNGAATEQYLDKKGRTILWRRFNIDDWAYSRYQKTWTEMLPENERITINNKTYVHWYDCLCDYICEKE